MNIPFQIIFMIDNKNKPTSAYVRIDKTCHVRHGLKKNVSSTKIVCLTFLKHISMFAQFDRDQIVLCQKWLHGFNNILNAHLL